MIWKGMLWWPSCKLLKSITTTKLCSLILFSYFFFFFLIKKSLRHVEYYRGILFLTTNRVKAFDEAFLSRIHIALHFHDLSHESKIQVWKAFISKIGGATATKITPEQISTLAKRNINGRQIKNAARTAHSLAVGKGEDVTFEHLNQTLDVMEEFQAEFRKRD